MSAVRVVDNTLTTIIASAVGGAIALLMGFMLLKNFTLFVLSKLEEKKWVFTATWILMSKEPFREACVKCFVALLFSNFLSFFASNPTAVRSAL